MLKDALPAAEVLLQLHVAKDAKQCLQVRQAKQKVFIIVEGQDSPEYISVHRVERLAEVHMGCQQPNAEVTQTLGWKLRDCAKQCLVSSFEAWKYSAQ